MSETVAQIHGLSLAFQAQFLAHAHPHDEQIRAATAGAPRINAISCASYWWITMLP